MTDSVPIYSNWFTFTVESTMASIWTAIAAYKVNFHKLPDYALVHPDNPDVAYYLRRLGINQVEVCEQSFNHSARPGMVSFYVPLGYVVEQK